MRQDKASDRAVRLFARLELWGILWDVVVSHKFVNEK
jgi:hypothetical protein